MTVRVSLRHLRQTLYLSQGCGTPPLPLPPPLLEIPEKIGVRGRNDKKRRNAWQDLVLTTLSFFVGLCGGCRKILKVILTLSCDYQLTLVFSAAPFHWPVLRYADCLWGSLELRVVSLDLPSPLPQTGSPGPCWPESRKSFEKNSGIISRGLQPWTPQSASGARKESRKSLKTDFRTLSWTFSDSRTRSWGCRGQRWLESDSLCFGHATSSADL